MRGQRRNFSSDVVLRLSGYDRAFLFSEENDSNHGIIHDDESIENGDKWFSTGNDRIISPFIKNWNTALLGRGIYDANKPNVEKRRMNFLRFGTRL